MMENNKSVESTISYELENSDTTSPLFPYLFVFRNGDQLNEYISNKLTSNRIAHDIKLTLGSLTLILPMFNLFMVYRSMIYQQESLSDAYSIFHSIIFYGEFVLVHFLLVGTLVLFVRHNLKTGKPSRPSEGQWVNLLDLEFTLMAFNLIKLIPILSVNGYNFILTEISLCAPVFLKASRSSRIICFAVLSLVILVEIIFLLGSLMLVNLVKVYQVAFVGEKSNPLEWTINQWLLFIGFAANIINITDTPTISQLSFMWSITNKTWSEDSNTWLHDQLAEKRKIHVMDQICRTLGFVKTFLWLRTMTANDVHSLVRLPPSVSNQSAHS